LHYALDIHVMQIWSIEKKSFVDPLDTADHTTEKPLGLRRVQWQAHERNIPSRNAAERVGFQSEGIVRYQRVLPHDNTHGYVGREGDGALGVSRSSWVGSVTWEDWECGLKEKIDGLVAR
jgi:RimJ/RimL family protein N-acetyltransferase